MVGGVPITVRADQGRNKTRVIDQGHMITGQTRHSQPVDKVPGRRDTLRGFGRAAGGRAVLASGPCLDHETTR